MNESINLSVVILIKLKTGLEIGFTDYDQNIIHAGTVCKPGIIVNKINNSSFQSQSNNEVIITLKKYDKVNLIDSECMVYLINRDNPSIFSLIFSGTVMLIKENLTEVEITIGSIIYKLNVGVGELFSKTCRAGLGDSRCKIDLQKITLTGSISAVLDKLSFVGTHAKKENDYFSNGVVSFSSGELKGGSFRIISDKNQVISISEDPGGLIKIGDSYQIIPGCQKTVEHCSKKFNNILNFRGEPFIYS